MARRWLHMPIALCLVLALLVGNVVAAQGLLCVMPSCKMCAPKETPKRDGCCPKMDPAPKPCCCVAPGDAHPDGVLVAKIDLPVTALVAVLPEPIEWCAGQPEAVPPPEARSLSPPAEDFLRAPCGRAPPAS